MNILLHADGGVGIGLGHASRCSALASALRRRGHASSVVVDASTGIGDYLRRLGVPAIEAFGDSDGMRRQARSFDAHAVVIDSYRWTAADFAAMRRARYPVVAFDDEGRRALPVDGLINGAPAAAQLAYDCLPHTRCWLGPAYQVIRDEFREVPPRTIGASVAQVIVLVGGDDPLGLLPPLAAQLDTLAVAAPSPFRAQLICGPYATMPDTSRFTHIEVVRHPADLRQRMRGADLAISASGQTLYELARCGTPTIAFCAGPDQAHNLAALAAAGVVVDTGEARDASWLERLTAALHAMIGDAAARREMSRRAQQLIDGGGADRVADEISRLVDVYPSQP